jgi:hypothetical protein
MDVLDDYGELSGAAMGAIAPWSIETAIIPQRNLPILVNSRSYLKARGMRLRPGVGVIR